MKLVFCGDENLYQKFHQHFEYENEDGEVDGSFFDREDYNFYHMHDKNYINSFINVCDGIKQVGDVIIQKSWYTNKQLWMILNRFKHFNPSVTVTICMDVSLSKNKVFMSEVITNQLGYIATSELELEELFSKNFELSQNQYVISKVKKKHKQKMLNAK